MHLLQLRIGLIGLLEELNKAAKIVYRCQQENVPEFCFSWEQDRTEHLLGCRRHSPSNEHGYTW